MGHQSLGTHFTARRHLLEDTYHPRLGLVENDIVDLVVSVHERTSVLGLSIWVAKVRDHLVKMRDLAHRHTGLLVLGRHLCSLDVAKCLQLSVVEAAILAKVLEPNVFRVHSVELSQRSNCVMPPMSYQYELCLFPIIASIRTSHFALLVRHREKRDPRRCGHRGTP